MEACVRSAVLSRPRFLYRKEIFINITICDLHLSSYKRLRHTQCTTEGSFSENPVHIRTRRGKVWLADSLGEQAPWCHVSNQGFVILMVILCGGVL